MNPNKLVAYSRLVSTPSVKRIKPFSVWKEKGVEKWPPHSIFITPFVYQLKPVSFVNIIFFKVLRGQFLGMYYLLLKGYVSFIERHLLLFPPKKVSFYSKNQIFNILSNSPRTSFIANPVEYVSYLKCLWLEMALRSFQ